MEEKVIKHQKFESNKIRIDGFFDENKQLKPELISDIGENNVLTLSKLLKESYEEEFIDKRTNRKKKNKVFDKVNINQLRKFYDTFLKIYYSQSDENTKKVQLLMFKAQAEYADIRLKITRFCYWVDNRVKIVISKNGDDFKRHLEAFKLHFEALIGYFSKDK